MGVDLHEVGSVGGFFALRTGEPGEGHMPLARLYAGDSVPLKDRVDTVATRLRTPERRVAASVAHLGLAARLWSVALGSAAINGELPDLDPAGLLWDPRLGSPDDLCLTGSGTLQASADTVREAVQYGHLVPLADALTADTRISRRLLWGNAGSALAGAVRELRAWALRGGRTDVAQRTSALAVGLFAHPDLSDTVAGPAMRRRTCCLYYRCPGGGLCGDCLFDHPPRRSAR